VKNTFERAGDKTIINHYLAYFHGAPMDLYVTQDERFVSTLSGAVTRKVVYDS
jgi:hypothetical protein